MRASIPQQRQEEVRPAYTVTPLEGTVPIVVRRFNAKTRKIETETVEESAGYMVKTMRGDEVRIKSVEDLRQYGLEDDIPLIAEMIGEEVGSIPNSAMKKGAN